TYLVEYYLQRDEAPEDEKVDLADLTPREVEVLELIAKGLTNAEIAENLTISVKTVDRHRENIMRKLNIHSRIDLVKYALKKGIIDLES
ncbi:MAG: response regulator transcription factor, partial [Anaerolineales bacterium]|nr:response regulator transcription factor [Anaerolineales bacterium]